MKRAIFFIETFIVCFFLVGSVFAEGDRFKIVNHCQKWELKLEKVEKILDRVMKLTGLNAPSNAITIEIFESKGDLFAFFQKTYGAYGGFKSWYDPRSNTIYISRKTYQDYVLAHEITHALINQQYGKLPKQIAEKIPNMVEEEF